MRVRSLLAVAALALAAAPGRAAAGPLPGFIHFQTGPAGRHGLAGRDRDVVASVVPWVGEHLRVDAAAAAIAGVSAGGFGAVDIGLRHPGLFATLESWSGYFTPPRDGTLARLSTSALAAYDPVLLARREAAVLRRDGTGFFLSSGTSDPDALGGTRAFARELRALRLPHARWLGPGAHDHAFWAAQLAPAIEYAFPPAG